MTSSWDWELAKLKIDNVRIHAGSLTEAWKAMSTEYLVRSVLVASVRALEGMPFDYESARCTVKDLYDALATTYELAWVQDELTGVTSDACRIVALSGYVRHALQAKSADAIVGVLKPLAAVVRLPIAGKLEFKLVTWES